MAICTSAIISSVTRTDVGVEDPAGRARRPAHRAADRHPSQRDGHAARGRGRRRRAGRRAARFIVLGGDYVTWGDRSFVDDSADALSRLDRPGRRLRRARQPRRRPRHAGGTRTPRLHGAARRPHARAGPRHRRRLVGLRYWTRRLRDVEAAARGYGPVTILIAHDPRRLNEAAELGIPLVLAGHTHGGQVVLPGIGPIAARKFPVRGGPGLSRADDNVRQPRRRHGLSSGSGQLPARGRGAHVSAGDAGASLTSSVAETSPERPGRLAAASRGPIGNEPASLDLPASAQHLRNRLRVQAVLFDQDPRRQRCPRCRCRARARRPARRSGRHRAPASTRWTVAPLTLTPCANAWRWACNPGNAGRSDGCTFRMRSGNASTKPGPSRRMKPARQTSVTSRFRSSLTRAAS